MTVEVYWLSAREDAAPRDHRWLSAREMAVVERTHIPKRRADWLLGRWTAKRAVAARLGLAADAGALAAIELWPAPSGAPMPFCRGVRAGLALSLSHSHGIGFCAVSRCGAALGCDVERVTPHSEAFLRDYFAEEERQAVGLSAPAERMKTATLLWSAKESTLKALERGLRCDPRTIRVNCGRETEGERSGWRRLTTSEPGGRRFEGWWRETRDFLWTVVEDPAPQAPAAL